MQETREKAEETIQRKTNGRYAGMFPGNVMSNPLA